MELREEKPLSPRILLTITRPEEGDSLEELFDSLHVPIFFQCRGKGTAPSELMDIFGLTGSTRLITAGILPKAGVQTALCQMRSQFSLHQRGAGIAFTLPVTGLPSHLLQLLQGRNLNFSEKTTQGDTVHMKQQPEYAAIWVSVTSGYSDDVIDAARDAGARGGTVLKGRRRDSERVRQAFGLSMQEEQDFVLIVVPREKRHAVMSALLHTCGPHTPANGVLLSLPVEQAVGLAE